MLSTVTGLGSKHQSAFFPVRVQIPQIEMDRPIEVEFIQMDKGWNGVLGHLGFLELFERVIFVPGNYFELVER
jgi:hypothetical protein